MLLRHCIIEVLCYCAVVLWLLHVNFSQLLYNKNVVIFFMVLLSFLFEGKDFAWNFLVWSFLVR